MRQPAARIRLDANAVAEQRIGPAQLFYGLLVDRRTGMKHFVEAKPRFDRFTVGGEAGLRQLGREHAVARAETDMQRLGHGAKVSDHTAGHRCRHAERHLNLAGVEPEQLAACRRGAEGTQRARRVPAVMFAVAQRMHELCRNLIANRIGFDDLPAAGAERFSQRKGGGNDRRRRLAHQGKAVIEIHRVRRRAVRQRRVERGSFESLPDDRGFFLGLFLACYLGANFRVLFLAAGERHTEAIAHSDLSGGNRRRR